MVMWRETELSIRHNVSLCYLTILFIRQEASATSPPTQLPAFVGI
jgi:hypothetical protein